MDIGKIFSFISPAVGMATGQGIGKIMPYLSPGYGAISGEGPFGKLFGGEDNALTQDIQPIDQMSAINDALARNEQMGQQGGWREALGQLGEVFSGMGGGGGGGSTNANWRPMEMEMFGRSGPAVPGMAPRSIEGLRARYDNFLGGGRY